MWVDFMTIAIDWRFGDTITFFLKYIVDELIYLDEFVD
jgi:hypothetical protein